MRNDNNNDMLWAFAMRASEELCMLDHQCLNDDTLYCLLGMGIFDWMGPDTLLNRQFIWGQPHLLGRCVKCTIRALLTLSANRLLNCVMQEEERCDCLKANTNMHI